MTLLSDTGKKCFKCGECKPLSEFYKHPQMADGHVNKCKTCNKVDVIANRLSKVEMYREYDRKRGSRQTNEDLKRYRAENPKKYAAHAKVNRAVRSGKLVAMACEICGSATTVAHHDDYNKPLDVRWLCQPHHVAWHVEHGEGRNAH